MKYSIAEILHYAADNCLASKKEQYWAYGGNKEKFSCCAVSDAVDKMHGFDITWFETQVIIQRICVGLSEMGCPTDSLDAFGEFFGQFVAENQQSRYAWLKFAAMMAEEQGV
jgi:hypothetical protein